MAPDAVNRPGHLVAEAVADGIARHGQVQLVEVGKAGPPPCDLDMLVLGGPTHAFGLSRPGTRQDAARQASRRVISERIGLREWIATLSGTGFWVPVATAARAEPVPGALGTDLTVHDGGHEGGMAEVLSSTLEWDAHSLGLGQARAQTAMLSARQARAIRPGDTVSLRWDWVCETPQQLRRLRHYTGKQLRLANASRR